MHELIVLKEKDYPVELSGIADIINDIQKHFKVILDKDTFELVEDETFEISISKSLNKFAQKQDYKTDKKYVIFTDRNLEDNFFNKTISNFSIVSTFQWEYLTDVDLEFGVVFFIVKLFYRFLRNKHRVHDEARGCIFDSRINKTDINFSIKTGKLCGKCKRAFQIDPNVNKKDLESIDKILDRMVESWRNGKSFSIKSEKIKTAHPELKWPFIPNQSTEYFTSDLEKIKGLENLFIKLELSRKSEVGIHKGKALESFVKHLFNCLNGFTFCGENLRLQDCEIDLSYRLNSQLSDLHRYLSPIILVECKNCKETASVQDISHHIVRLSHRRLNAGIFVSLGGISGYIPHSRSIRDGLSLIVEEYRQNKRLILPIVWDDIIAVRRGLNFYSLLDSKVNEIILK